METGLRRLRYFHALAAGLNFRRTAKRLNITQPALSRAIAQLEAEIGTLLFARTNRQVALTRAGEVFARGCARTLTSIDAMVDETRRVARGSSGTLVIGYTDTVIAGRLPDIVDGFAKLEPGVTIRLVQAYTTRQMGMLDGGHLDIGIMTGPVSHPGLTTCHVQSDRFMAFLPAAHPLAAARRMALADLSDEAFVIGDPDRWSAYNLHLMAHCDRAGFQPRVVQTAPESLAILGLVSCGIGIAILPASLATVLDHRVVACRIVDLQARLDSFACWPAAEMQPTVRRFVDHLAAAASPRRPPFPSMPSSQNNGL